MGQEDLQEISDFISSTAQDYILNRISSKEINELDIEYEISYEEELNIKMSINLQVDDLSTYDDAIVDKAMDHTFKALDLFLDEHFRC